MTDQDLAAVTAQIKDHEGLKLKPYTDTTGHLTIGYGRNLSERGITPDEAEQMLSHDIASTIGALSFRLPWFPTLDGIRQRVLIDMAYNMGAEGVASFHNMISAIRVKDWDDAANEMLNSKWATQVGQRAIRLARMMRTGQP